MIERSTTKLYWKKWDHKVTLFLGKQDPSDELAALVKIKAKATSVKRTVLTLLGAKENFKFLRSVEFNSVHTYSRTISPHNFWSGQGQWEYHHKHFITFYFNDSTLVDALKLAFPHDITLIEKPFNAAHQKALNAAERCILREKLWYERYRFCMRSSGTISGMTQAVYDDMLAWLKKNLIQGRGRQRRKDFDYRGDWSWGIHFYFVHPDDAMFFRLTWSDYFRTMDRIKLISELTDDSDEVA